LPATYLIINKITIKNVFLLIKFGYIERRREGHGLTHRLLETLLVSCQARSLKSKFLRL